MNENNTEISARVAEMIKFLHETPNSFAKELGYKRAQTIYDIISGKSAPSYDFFNKVAIAEISASVNLKWLITGIGCICDNVNDETMDAAAPHTDIVDKLLGTIKEQAEEIGSLRERISQFEREKKKDVSAASASGIANAG